MLSAVNAMMFDAIARKDYTGGRKHQAQDVQKAKKTGKYKGRPENMLLQLKIEGLLKEGKSYCDIQI